MKNGEYNHKNISIPNEPTITFDEYLNKTDKNLVTMFHSIYFFPINDMMDLQKDNIDFYDELRFNCKTKYTRHHIDYALHCLIDKYFYSKKSIVPNNYETKMPPFKVITFECDYKEYKENLKYILPSYLLDNSECIENRFIFSQKPGCLKEIPNSKHIIIKKNADEIKKILQ